MKTVEIIVVVCTLLTLPALYVMRQYNTERDNYKFEEVSKVISAEACGEGDLGMWIIANTIDNRSKEYKISHYAVVVQPEQYYGHTNKNKDILYTQCKETADIITSKLYSGTLYDFTKGALYIRRIDEPRRDWHKVETFRYKNHISYK